MRRLRAFDRKALTDMLERALRRRATPVLTDLRIGERFGRYREPIERVEILDTLAATPQWFDPRTHPGHVSVHAPGGRSAYLILTVNAEQRARIHPFDHIIAANAVRKAVQLDLLGMIQN